jgi:hypothetical protein
MTNYTAQLTQTETIALHTVAQIFSTTTSAMKTAEKAARTFYANEIATGLLQADIARSIAVLQSCAIVAGLLLREAAIWCVFACLFTLHCWKEDSEQRAIAQVLLKFSQPALAATQASLKTVARGLAQFIIKALRFALWLERVTLVAYFSYLANWAALQRRVRNFAS